MAIDTDVPFSPGWWLRVLAKQLHDRRTGRCGKLRYNPETVKSLQVRPGVDLLDSYYNGDPPLHQVANEWKSFVRQFIRMSRLNVADLLVTSVTNRMQLRDFRTSAANDESGDVAARNLMRANDMALKVRDVHEWAFAHGDSYALVTPPDSRRTYPLMTAESAQQVITAHDAATGETLAALKLFRDEWDTTDFAYVFCFDSYENGPTGSPQLHVATKAGTSSITDAAFRWSKSWEWDREESVRGPDIPVVRFQNRKGVGEFEQHLGTLDRINDKIANEWWVIKIQAFRQRAVKNLPDVDSQGKRITGEDWQKVFVADPGSLWKIPADAEFWESQPTDVTPITNAVKEDLERLAAATSTGLHTLLPDAENQSAQGSSHKREESIFKVEDRRDRFSGSWAKVMALMFAYAGDETRADVTQIEPIWGPVERYSLQEKAEAVAKMSGKIPTERLWTDYLQYPPAEVPALRAQQGRDMLTQPAPVAPSPSPNGTEPQPQPQPRPAPAST